MSILECKNVTLGYRRDIVAENLSFNLCEGNYLSIVGENGVGKSTLVKAILGLHKPISGEIVFNGISPRDIGYLPQQEENQRDFPATVSEIVYSGFLGKRGFRPFYTKEEKIVADGYMFLVGVSERKKAIFSQLSGGLQQRVLLARALCAAGKLILLDEPTASLDPRATIEFYKLIDMLNSGNNITVICVTHDINSALAHSSHILHISKEDTFFGSTEDYIKSDKYKAFTAGTAAKETK